MTDQIKREKTEVENAEETARDMEMIVKSVDESIAWHEEHLVTLRAHREEMRDARGAARSWLKRAQKRAKQALKPRAIATESATTAAGTE